MASSSPSPPEDHFDLDDWEPEDPVLAEVPGAAQDFLEARQSDPLQEESPAAMEGIAVHRAEDDPSPDAETAMQRASFQSDPDLFLKCLAILETALRLREKQGLERGQPATKEDLFKLAMSTLQVLPLDLETNRDFLVPFVARAIGAAQESVAAERFQFDLKRAQPNVLPDDLPVNAPARSAAAPAETAEAMASISSDWGHNALDLGLGQITFDDGRAVIEDVQQIPGIGKALFSKQGRFRSSFYRTLFWSSVICAFALLSLVLLTSIRRTAPDPDAVESNLVDATLYTSPDLDKLEQALDGFIGSEDWPSQLGHIRHPALMEDKMRTFYESSPFRWGMTYNLISANLEILGNIPQVLCLVELEPTKENRAFLVEVTEEGEYLVDWEYAELWQEVPWNEFRSRTDDTPSDMLVILKPGKYFNFRYKDAKEFQCWLLLDPSEEGFSYYGYSRRDSEVGKTLQRLLRDRFLATRSTLFSLVVKLQHPADAEDPMQVDILEVVEESPLRRH